LGNEVLTLFVYKVIKKNRKKMEREPEDDILFETDFGSVRIVRYCNKLRIIYGNLILEQSHIEFRHFLSKLRNLSSYVSEIRHSYYRKFIIRLKKYTGQMSFDSKEVEELYELIGGAHSMLELEQMMQEINRPILPKS